MCGYLQWGDWYTVSGWVIKNAELLKSREERCYMLVCLYRTRWALQKKGNITEAALQKANIEVTLHLSSTQAGDVTVSVTVWAQSTEPRWATEKHQTRKWVLFISIRVFQIYKRMCVHVHESKISQWSLEKLYLFWENTMQKYKYQEVE